MAVLDFRNISFLALQRDKASLMIKVCSCYWVARKLIRNAYRRCSKEGMKSKKGTAICKKEVAVRPQSERVVELGGRNCVSCQTRKAAGPFLGREVRLLPGTGRFRSRGENEVRKRLVPVGTLPG